MATVSHHTEQCLLFLMHALVSQMAQKPQYVNCYTTHCFLFMVSLVVLDADINPAADCCLPLT
jgi:hypothetical protein